ncbi:MAG: hypothetical protein Q8P56_01025 [Candidatus Uhrbacteria bacterium]|nr:hypothetical protein [Candidatus Uhrbacteria bacterium]
MTIQEAITKAIEGGWNKEKHWRPIDTPDSNRARMFLDPYFWQSLGKALGWSGEKIRMCIGCGVSCKNSEVTAYGKHKGWWNGQKWTGCDSDIYEYDGQWLIEMHRLIDHLAEEKSIESFFEQL